MIQSPIPPMTYSLFPTCSCAFASCAESIPDRIPLTGILAGHVLSHVFSFTLLLPCLRVFDPHSNYLHFHDASRRDLECTWSLPRVYPAQRDDATRKGGRPTPGHIVPARYGAVGAWRRPQAMNLSAIFCRLTFDDQHSIITPERDHAC